MRAGDEHVFAELVQRWGTVMLRMALAQAGNRAIAEEVVQEAWLTLLRSLDRFEHRSTLRTWLLGIVVNLARSRARAERRAAPVSADTDGPSVDPDRFLPAGHPRWPHHWATEPVPWANPENALLAAETQRIVLEAIGALPPAQREVLLLRDVEGLTAAEACNILGLTDTHQRVLLHRGRSRVRQAVDRYLAAAEAT